MITSNQCACPHCQQQITIDPQLTGQAAKCPACFQIFTMPADPSTFAPAATVPTVQTTKPKVYLRRHRGQTILILGILSLFVASFILGLMA